MLCHVFWLSGCLHYSFDCLTALTKQWVYDRLWYTFASRKFLSVTVWLCWIVPDTEHTTAGLHGHSDYPWHSVPAQEENHPQGSGYPQLRVSSIADTFVLTIQWTWLQQTLVFHSSVDSITADTSVSFTVLWTPVLQSQFCGQCHWHLISCCEGTLQIDLFLESTLSENSSCKPGVGQEAALPASLSKNNSAFLTSTFPVHSTGLFPNPLSTESGMSWTVVLPFSLLSSQFFQLDYLPVLFQHKVACYEQWLRLVIQWILFHPEMTFTADWPFNWKFTNTDVIDTGWTRVCRCRSQTTHWPVTCSLGTTTVWETMRTAPSSGWQWKPLSTSVSLQPVTW